MVYDVVRETRVFGSCLKGTLGNFLSQIHKTSLTLPVLIIFSYSTFRSKTGIENMKTAMHYGASKIIFQFAKDLRKVMTEAEKIIWGRVCNNQLGVRIRRQHPIDNCIADYYCHKLKLVIEIDGGIHLSEENKQKDKIREAGSENYCLLFEKQMPTV